jgi:membrane protein YqaA with SNARE-associated domain
MTAVVTALSIVIYGAACTLFWPTPSEAPLLFYPQVPLVWILALSVAGKVIGALAILAGWAQVTRLAGRDPQWLERLRDWVRARLARYGFLAYLAMQAVPFMPMRSSLYVYAGIARDWRPVVLGIAVGTVVRNLLMLVLFMRFLS